MLTRTLTLAALAAGGLFAASVQAQTIIQGVQQSPCQGGRQFVVYFPAGKADVTDAAKSTVQQAATFAGAAGSVSITGHTDATEADIVSMQRTAALSEALTKQGVAVARIKTNAASGNKPAVPTANPEPLNRRAEICVMPAA